MLKNPLAAFIACALLSGCAYTQSIVKGTFPYTTDLKVASNAQPGTQCEATAVATSFDQNFSKNNGDRINGVHVISARLRVEDPSNFDMGNIKEARFYCSKPDGTDEVMVASSDYITPGAGNTMALDIDNTNFLDKLVRMPNMKVRMVYKLRNNIHSDATLHLVLGVSGYPNN